MAAWLFKTEPTVYSFEDLRAEGEATWDGVTNPGALINLRRVQKGDDVFIYHTGDEKSVVGLARVTRGSHPDPKRPELNAEGQPRFAVVRLKAVRKAQTPLSLAAMKGDRRFTGPAATGFDLLRNARLSAMPVPEAIERLIREETGL